MFDSVLLAHNLGGLMPQLYFIYSIIIFNFCIFLSG